MNSETNGNVGNDEAEIDKFKKEALENAEPDQEEHKKGFVEAGSKIIAEMMDRGITFQTVANGLNQLKSFARLYRPNQSKPE